MRGLRIAVAAFVVACFSCAVAWSTEAPAEPFSAQVSGAPAGVGGSDSWIYTLRNTSSEPSFVIWLLQIEVDPLISVLSYASPAGWSASVDPQTPNLVTWFCGSQYLCSKEAVGGFRVTYAAGPTYQGWTVMFDNELVPGDTRVAFGEVQTPEPASAATLIGLLSMAGLAGRRRN